MSKMSRDRLRGIEDYVRGDYRNCPPGDALDMIAEIRDQDERLKAVERAYEIVSQERDSLWLLKEQFKNQRDALRQDPGKTGVFPAMGRPAGLTLVERAMLAGVVLGLVAAVLIFGGLSLVEKYWR